MLLHIQLYVEAVQFPESAVGSGILPIKFIWNVVNGCWWLWFREEFLHDLRVMPLCLPVIAVHFRFRLSGCQVLIFREGIECEFQVSRGDGVSVGCHVLHRSVLHGCVFLR